MPEVAFENLLAVALIALLAPLTLGLAPALRIPAVVLEILSGIAVGPSGLVCAGLLSVVLFPTGALSLMRPSTTTLTPTPPK